MKSLLYLADYSPLQLLHGSHLDLQQETPLQLGHGAHGAHLVGQQPVSQQGDCVAQPASNIAPAAIANNPVFIIHFPLYFKLKTNH